MQLLQLALSALLLGGQGPNPNSQFDWTIASGEIFVFNTVSQTITSTPPLFQQTALNGFVEVRNFTIEEGGKLVVEGPNPMVLSASGIVVVNGRLSINGANNPDHPATSADRSRPGAKGHGGGGDGGAGSPLTTMSSPAGETGFGAFGVPGTGGRGGESGWSISPSPVAGGGGGGGVFGANQTTLLVGLGMFDQGQIGLDAEHGFYSLADNGVTSGPGKPRGGAVGEGPFIDSLANNNFFGTAVVESTGALIVGELSAPWAGAGGGGGGDGSLLPAGTTYPPVSMNENRMGAGGGGGAGSLRIRARGPIILGPAGVITAKGGNGTAGGGKPFLPGYGGGSGGGSGGHLILETADHIDLSQVVGRALLARGGQGGADWLLQGGAAGSLGLSITTKPRKDACPEGYPTTGPNSCLGQVDGAGGDGGPGVIQLHTPRGLRDIALPPGKSLDNLAQPRPLCWDGGCRMLVSFDSTGSPDARVSSGEQLLPSGKVTLESLRMRSGR